ncbi:hemolysin III family protein [Roseovarius sp. SCSIO 43702]|uniref:PAQR family membrane homeostasis protein TrhA n=1 Tax=Roseovarius sp. SCSIO 43702 TaxID=2823043 RepID=UPI001C735FAC|nr:hemolysin III family protein [Roseovarius sp. SCSIO 43702]QYX57816.1 hemolysin III family protein [Roseovarius sp. SCSIO 43702]
MSYPDFSRAERIADGTIHVAGVGIAVCAVTALFLLTGAHLSGGTLTAAIIYAGGLLCMLGASAAYHLAAYTAARPYLRRLDHAAIYMKIAGTLTPLAVLLGTAYGYGVLALVWVLAVTGMWAKLRAKRGRMSTGWLPYVALGWVAVALIVPLMEVLPPVSFWSLVIGGLLYTAGVVFYVWENLRFSMAIWHGFILLASGCVFTGIASALGAAPH